MQLSPSTVGQETARLKGEVARWERVMPLTPQISMASRAGWVRTDTESEALLHVPLAEVLATAQALSGRRGELFVEHDPYAGLAAKRPVRATSSSLGAVEEELRRNVACKRF